MEEKELLGEVARVFEKEPKLIQLPSHGKAVFAGDTHGDLDATERILSRFMGGIEYPGFSGRLCGSGRILEGEYRLPSSKEMGTSGNAHPSGGQSRRVCGKTLLSCQFLGDAFNRGEGNLWLSLLPVPSGCDLFEWNPGRSRRVARSGSSWKRSIGLNGEMTSGTESSGGILLRGRGRFWEIGEGDRSSGGGISSG